MHHPLPISGKLMIYIYIMMGLNVNRSLHPYVADGVFQMAAAHLLSPKLFLHVTLALLFGFCDCLDTEYGTLCDFQGQVIKRKVAFYPVFWNTCSGSLQGPQKPLHRSEVALLCVRSSNQPAGRDLTRRAWDYVKREGGKERGRVVLLQAPASPGILFPSLSSFLTATTGDILSQHQPAKPFPNSERTESTRDNKTVIISCY